MRAEQKTDVKNSVGRMAFVILSVLIQAGWILLIVLRLNRYSWLIALISTIAALVVVLTWALVSSRAAPAPREFSAPTGASRVSA